MRRHAYSFSLVFLLAFTANAQERSPMPSSAGRAICGNSDLSIRIAYANEQPVTEPVQVRLQRYSGELVGQGVTDSSGQTVFHDLRPGDYRADIRGPEIMATTSELLTLEPCQGTSMHVVYVKPVENKTQQAPGGMISLNNINIPDKARKEFDKGTAAMEHNDLAEATKRFGKAVEIYPKYAVALDNLGVLAIQQKDEDAARNYFERAVAADGQFTDAYMNLGKLDWKEQKFKEAEPPLEKAVALDPKNVEAMTVLAHCQLLNGENEAAIVTAKKVHSLPHEKFAVSHMIAARALEASNHPAEAIQEYQLFLKEAPQHPLAGDAQQSIARLQLPH